jgi:hypothetical protein
MAGRASTTDAETQLKSFIAKFEPKHQTLLPRRAQGARFIRLESADQLTRPEVEGLLAAAAAQAKTPFAPSGRGDLIGRELKPSPAWSSAACRLPRWCRRSRACRPCSCARRARTTERACWRKEWTSPAAGWS